MMDPDEKDAAGLPLTCRAVFVIGKDKRLKLSILYPATTGRNFDEILRVIDSLQLTAEKKVRDSLVKSAGNTKQPSRTSKSNHFSFQVATPVDWQKGGSCMVVPSVKTEDAGKLFPKGFTVHEVPSGKQYLRTTPMPE